MSSSTSSHFNSPFPSFRLSRFIDALSEYSPAIHRLVFSSAFTWHTLAARYFIISPYGILRSLTNVTPISFLTMDVMQYLGGLNIGYAILALQGLFLDAYDVAGRKRTALILSIANGSQVWFTLKFWRLSRWSLKGMVPIFIGNAIITLITALYYLQSERKINKAE